MDEKMKLWQGAMKTDPSYTKEYSGAGGYSGTSINGHYMVMRATEAFGPIGIGWGYEVLEERYDTGHPLLFDAEGNETLRSMTHVLKLKLWYMMGEKRGEVVHFGITPYISRNKHGPTSDPEAPKKSLTDALKKCLSMLGFGADVYLGQFDDISYVQAVAGEFGIEKAENKDEEIERQRQEYISKMAKYAEQIKSSVTKTELMALKKEAVRKAGYRNDTASVRRLEQIAEERLKELEEKDNA